MSVTCLLHRSLPVGLPRRLHWRGFAVLGVAILSTAILVPAAHAHFIWLAPCVDAQDEPGPGETATSLEVFFGEDSQPDNPALLDLLSEIQIWRLDSTGAAEALKPSRAGDSLAVKLDASTPTSTSLYVAAQDFGVREKGGGAFLLKYYAKAGPSADQDAWQKVSSEEKLALDVRPKVDGAQIVLEVAFEGSPAVGAEVVVIGPGIGDFSGETGTDGSASLALGRAGRYAIRVRHVVPTAGEVDGKKYDDVRHYSTVTLDVPTSLIPLAVDRARTLPDLPMTLTSFGGAVVDQHVYVYGGTTGTAHEYSQAVQNAALLRLDLSEGRSPRVWETLAEGPRLQGLAMVGHRGQLYRVGGFEARNAAGEEHDLWSSASVARFDPDSGQWTELAPLPEPRSSLDAAVLGDEIYVIGGWAMAGDSRSVWHTTAWKLDLSQPAPQWEAIAEPPFERRALALAAHDGRIYAIGGMTSGDETTRQCDLYDPAADRWSSAPELIGEDGMTGFGASAFATGGKLYVSTIRGTLQRLSDDGSQWEVIGKTPTARFFHRMLPIDDRRFVLVGGSSFGDGRIRKTEVFSVPATH